MADVPKQFHFVFGLKPQTEPFHIAYYLALASCRAVNQPEAIFFYYHYEPYGPWWERIRPHLTLRRVEPVEFITRNELYWQHQEGSFIRQFDLDYAHQADFVRLQILLERGGIYADIDTLFVKPLPADLFAHEFVLGSEGLRTDPRTGEEYESLCNALILARPDAEFARLWLEEMYRVFDGTWDRHSCYTAARLSRRFPAAIHIAPRNYFYHYRHTSEEFRLLFEERDIQDADIYSIHLWNHLWWEPSRNDFTQFHKGMLTEQYVREVDTTYNLLARQFLD